MKIALCIPMNGQPEWSLLRSVAQWQAYHYRASPEIPVDIILPPRALPVDVARNFLAQQVVDGDYDYLWFVDQDADFNPRTLERLMGWDKGIVGALCMIRGSEACWPMVFRGRQAPESDYWHIAIDQAYNYLRQYADVETNVPQVIEPIPDGSLFEADFTGCHCLLIKADVLRALPPPWFHGQPGQEDRYFCLKAIEAGHKVWVDFSTIVGHATGSRTIGVWDFMSHYLYKSMLEGVLDEQG